MAFYRDEVVVFTLILKQQRTVAGSFDSVRSTKKKAKYRFHQLQSH